MANEKTARATVNKQMRRAWFFDAQGGLCCHCGKPMVLDGKRDLMATFEHLEPRGKRRRGTNVANTLLAHARCNEQRGTRPVEASLYDRAKELWEKYFVWRAAFAPPPPQAQE